VKKRIAVYPGSFDPVTNGHIDIIRRACTFFDEVIVAVLANRSKTPIFTVEERLELLRQSIKGIKGARVDSFSGLLVEYMRKNDIRVAVRGLRAVSDLEYEFQLAHTNRTLNPDMETIFLMPGVNYVYLTSSTVREVASHGSMLSTYVPVPVAKALRRKFGGAQ